MQSLVHHVQESETQRRGSGCAVQKELRGRGVGGGDLLEAVLASTAPE